VIIYGVNPILEAIRSHPERIRYVGVAREETARHQRLASEAKRAGVAVRNLPLEAIQRLAGGGVHNGVVAEISETAYADFDDIVAKLPVQFRPYMAFIIVSMCDDAKKPEFDSFFEPKIEKFDGGPRAMAQAIEQLHVCSVARKAEAPGVEAFLKNQ